MSERAASRFRGWRRRAATPRGWSGGWVLRRRVLPKDALAGVRRVAQECLTARQHHLTLRRSMHRGARSFDPHVASSCVTLTCRVCGGAGGAVPRRGGKQSPESFSLQRLAAQQLEQAQPADEHAPTRPPVRFLLYSMFHSGTHFVKSPLDAVPGTCRSSRLPVVAPCGHRRPVLPPATPTLARRVCAGSPSGWAGWGWVQDQDGQCSVNAGGCLLGPKTRHLL